MGPGGVGEARWSESTPHGSCGPNPQKKGGPRPSCPRVMQEPNPFEITAVQTEAGPVSCLHLTQQALGSSFVGVAGKKRFLVH
jgi:hypothetical protein